MATTVNVQDAKTHLSRLLARAASGEDIVIARGGVPIVRLVPVDRPAARELGFVAADLPEEFWAGLSDDELELWT